MAIEEIEWVDVQCLLRRGLGWLNRSAYVLLTITDGDKARNWVANLAVTSGTDIENRQAPPRAVNIAFTFPGLCQLGFEPDMLGGFSNEFREGMAPRPADGDITTRRSSMLGDVGANTPARWRWGGTKSDAPALHVQLMVFGDTDPTKHAQGLCAPEGKTGLRIIETLPGWLPADKREHFGFRDGLSQPILPETGAPITDPSAARLHQAAPGEFIIGYRNERGNFPTSPKAPDGSDFGFNGSYLVLRELEQFVPEFESWLDRAARKQPVRANADPREWIAAKMIGRWRNGAPLTRYPDQDEFSQDFGPFDPQNKTQSNDFFYHAEDREGFRCPVGAHIRRAWPRDGLGADPERALLQAKLHRLLRRGRLFGPPYDRDNPESQKNAPRRGLHFACLNADIAGQFEAVQNNWINNPKFSGLTEESDPLVGERSADDCMTIQHSPVNLRLQGLAPFVKTCGGGYFFMPGLRALRRLSDT